MLEQLIEKLKNDSEYRLAWEANIAMSFKDNYYWHKKRISKIRKVPNKKDIHEISNKAAEHFIDLICKDNEKGKIK